MKTYTQSELEPMTANELDEIYFYKVGYRPMQDDGVSRDELIEMILGMQHEERINPLEINHSFFDGPCQMYLLQDKSAVFVWPNGKDLQAWYTGMVIDDLPKFLAECQDGMQHETLGSGFSDSRENIMKQLYAELERPTKAPTAHTPGPWIINEGQIFKDFQGALHIPIETDKQIIAEVHCENASMNARLISCAPEMLEALERLRAELKWYGMKNDKQGNIKRLREICETIIKKAKGC